MATIELTLDEQAYNLGKIAGEVFATEEPGSDRAYEQYQIMANLCATETEERVDVLATAWNKGILFTTARIEAEAEAREEVAEAIAVGLLSPVVVELDFLPLVNHEAKARNDRGRSVDYPCLLCGKECKHGRGARAFYLGGGGVTLLTPPEYHRQAEAQEESGEDQGLMGTYPIGPECFAKHVEILEPFVAGRW